MYYIWLPNNLKMGSSQLINKRMLGVLYIQRE